MPETPVSERALYSARPTLRIAGEENERLTGLLLAMRMDEAEGGMSRLDLRFSNLASTTDGSAEIAFADDADVHLGAAISVYAGDAEAPQEIFRGRITSQELVYTVGDAPQMQLLAEDALQSARLARRSKVYSDQSPADVVRSVAQVLGLTPTVNGLDAPTGTWAQIGESDLAFLRRLLARFDADLQIVGDELQVSPRGEVRRGDLELAMFSQLARVRVCADLADQVSKMTCAGWNPVDGAAVNAEVSQATHAGPGEGRSGAEMLREALGERTEHIGHLALASDREAQAVAEAAFDGRARRFVRLEGVAEGNPGLRVGTHVSVTGITSQYENTYYITRASHLYDLVQGYRTEFSGECAYLGR